MRVRNHALVAAGAVMWAGAAVAQPAPRVGVVIRHADDPPVTAGELQRQLATVAGQAGQQLVSRPLATARRRLRAGAVRRERLERFARARQLADEGWRAYLRVDAAFASSRLVEALRVAEEVIDLDGGLEALADVSLRMGAVRLYLGRGSEAADAFRLAFALDPNREVTTREFAPDVVAAYREAADAPATPVDVRMAVEPAGAHVEVDGRDVGTAPLALELSAGLHTVVARAPDHVATGQVVRVSPGAGSVELSLPRDDLAVALGDGALAVGQGEREAGIAVEAASIFGELDAIAIVAPVWRRGAPALLGQLCRGVPAACTRVIEVTSLAAPRLPAAVAELWSRMLDAPAEFSTPTLIVDRRLTAGESRPGDTRPPPPPGARWWQNPWLWLGVSAAVVSAGGAWLLTRDGDSGVAVGVDPCEFGPCP